MERKALSIVIFLIICSQILLTVQASAGVSIVIYGDMSCGTCLEYYNLREKLSVGSVTNMYDTVSSLLSADKIIKL